jgi:hypothetical protein
MSDESVNPTQPEPQPAEPEIGAGLPEAEPSAEPQPAEIPASSGPTAAEAWNDVVTKLSELSDAISAWAKAAADTPENRKHVDDVRNGVDDMARRANEAFASVSGSDFGRQFAEGASQMGSAIGESAQEFGAAAAPHVATAFAGLADVFGRAAQKVGETVSPPSTPDPAARPAPEPPAAATPMPSAEPVDAPEAEPAAPESSAPGSWHEDGAKE